MEVETEGTYSEVVIQIEHQSEKEDVSERVYEYSCYAWLLKKKPVWSIVIYTDEAVWRKTVSGSFWYAFDSGNGKQHHHFDVVKVKAEKSGDLIRKHSLMCRLLALKADDRGTDPEELVCEIYRAAAEMKDRLTNGQLLLLDQWVAFYKKISDRTLDRIKKEADMEFVETTISEHIFNQGILRGKAEGKAEGRKEAAANLLKLGIDIKIITQATGLSEEEIKQIRN